MRPTPTVIPSFMAVEPSVDPVATWMESGHQGIAEWVRYLVAHGLTRLEWCLHLKVDQGVRAGAVFLRSAEPGALRLAHVMYPSSEAWALEMLLDRSIRLMRKAGHRCIEFHALEGDAVVVEALEKQGFESIQELTHLVGQTAGAGRPGDFRLQPLRSFPPNFFAAECCQAMAAAEDRRLLHALSRVNVVDMTSSLVELIQLSDYDPDAWFVVGGGYGVIGFQVRQDQATLNLAVGRFTQDRGLCREVLNEALACLRERGVGRILAWVDSQRRNLIDTLTDMGFIHADTSQVYLHVR